MKMLWKEGLTQVLGGRTAASVRSDCIPPVDPPGDEPKHRAGSVDRVCIQP